MSPPFNFKSTFSENEYRCVGNIHQKNPAEEAIVPLIEKGRQT